MFCHGSVLSLKSKQSSRLPGSWAVSEYRADVLPPASEARKGPGSLGLGRGPAQGVAVGHSPVASKEGTKVGQAEAARCRVLRTILTTPDGSIDYLGASSRSSF